MNNENIKFYIFILNLRLKIQNLKEKHKDSGRISCLCESVMNTLNVYTPSKILNLEKRIL